MKSREFWQGETVHIVRAMKATGNRSGIIQQWKDAVANWAKMTPGDGNAEAVKSWLPLWEVRPFYTAQELAPMWPALAIATGFTNRWPAVLKSAGRLKFELDWAGLPRLMDGDYFIVERIHYWATAPAEEIEREFHAQR